MNKINAFVLHTKKLDWIMVGAVAGLAVIGLVSLYSSSLHLSDFGNFQKQIIFLVLGFVFIFMLLIALLFTALGTGIASLLEDMQGFQLIMNFLVMPLFFFSNALFPVQGLPRALQLIVRVNPLTYGVDGVRGAFGNSFVFGVGTDFAVLGTLAMILLGVGSYLFAKIQL